MASQGGGSPSEVGITWRRRNDETPYPFTVALPLAA